MRNGLADYVRAVDPKACRGKRADAVTLDTMLFDGRAAMAAAINALEGSDRPTALFLVGAARSQLGRVDERFRLPGLEPSRELLRRSDVKLRAIEAAIRSGAPEARRQMQDWQRRWPELKRQLQRQEKRSFFSRHVLRRYLAS